VGRNQDTPLLLTVPEAAAKLGISRSSFYELIRGKKLEIVKIGRSTRIPESDIVSFVERLRFANATRT